MSKRARRTFSKEEKADAVELIRSSGLSLAQISRDIGIGENSLRRWLKQADIDNGLVTGGDLSTTEREELRRLRRENRELQLEREFLKKAAAYFAKDTTQHTK